MHILEIAAASAVLLLLIAAPTCRATGNGDRRNTRRMSRRHSDQSTASAGSQPSKRRTATSEMPIRNKNTTAKPSAASPKAAPPAQPATKTPTPQRVKIGRTPVPPPPSSPVKKRPRSPMPSSTSSPTSKGQTGSPHAPNRGRSGSASSGIMRFISRVRGDHQGPLPNPRELIPSGFAHNLDVAYYTDIQRASKERPNVRFLRAKTNNVKCVVKHSTTGVRKALRRRHDSSSSSDDSKKKEREVYPESIEQEIRILDMLNNVAEPSPFIMQIFDSFTYKGNVYEVLEFIDGDDIYTRIINNEVDRKMRHYIAQIVLALKFVHDQGIIYDDLKPENLMLSKNNRVVLIDFGVSTLMPKDGSKIRNGFGGSLDYSPPEKLLNYIKYKKRPGYDHRADFYSLGITIYTMYCGELPFMEDLNSRINRYVNNEYKDSPLRILSPLNDVSNRDALQLIYDLTIADPASRLGAKRGVVEIMEHDYFKSEVEKAKQEGEDFWEMITEKYRHIQVKEAYKSGAIKAHIGDDSSDGSLPNSPQPPRESPKPQKRTFTLNRGAKKDDKRKS